MSFFANYHEPRWLHTIKNVGRQLLGRPLERYGDWIITRTGKKFYTLDPRWWEIDIRDIASGLAKKCRYEGQCEGFYSVAEHVCWSAYAAPPGQKLTCLLHDATEAYMPDIARPTKRGWGWIVADTEHRLATAIHERFVMKDCRPDAYGGNCEYPYPPIVKIIDNRMLATERQTIISGPEWRKFEYDNPYDFAVQSWPWEVAEKNFLDYFDYLRGWKKEPPAFAAENHPGLHEAPLQLQ